MSQFPFKISNIRSLHWAVAIMLSILVSCGPSGKGVEMPRRGKTCSKKKVELNIVNGANASDPGVKMILLYNKSGSFIDRCTGVFISSTVLLTAGHCVLNREFEGGNVGRAVLADTNESSTNTTHHPKYTVGTGLTGLLQNGLNVAKASHSEYDLAVIEFEPRKREIFKVGSSGKVGDLVTITGYGDTEQVTTTVRSNYKKMAPAEREAYMRKTFNQKTATSKIEKVDSLGYFYLKYGNKNGQAFAAFGDSGGPLLNSNRETIGVTSCGDPKNLLAGANGDILNGDWRNVYTDINTPSSQAFLKAYISETNGMSETSQPMDSDSSNDSDANGNSVDAQNC